MMADYYAYEERISRAILIPLLEKQGLDWAGKAVLEVGCGYGGVLGALWERFSPGRALGVDIDGEMIRAGRGRCPRGVSLETGDFFALQAGSFDLIVMRDVLEHIRDVERAMAKAGELLKPGGILYVTFAPFFSPFGGHQHIASGFFSRCPWLQFLPEALFRKLLRLRENSYKSDTGLEADLDSVLGTRLTLFRFRRLQRKLGFISRHYAQYLVRPDFRIKFGIPCVPFPVLPPLDDLLCTGVEALLQKPADP